MILVAHPGTQHSHRLARELERKGVLGEFWTGLAFRERGAAAAIVERLGAQRLVSRIAPGIPAGKLRTQPLGELRALWRLRRGCDSHAVLHARNAAFQRAIPDSSLARAGGVIGFDTSSWILAERCLHHGRTFFLERSIAHPAALVRLMEDIARRYPDWANPARQRPAELVEAEAKEHELAHRIVVGGSFARDTLIGEGIDPGKIRVIPYGVEWEELGSERPRERPLRFLFAGSVTARKGAPVLLEAWRALAPRDAELWLAGSIGARERRLIPPLSGLRVFGHVPRPEMRSLYAQCDVFVLPSLFEGFGLVILEALAAGLPVISTPHTGALDVLTVPTLGRLVEVGSVDALVSAMRHYLDVPPSRTAVKSAAAALRSAFSWEAYGERWSELLHEGA